MPLTPASDAGAFRGLIGYPITPVDQNGELAPAVLRRLVAEAVTHLDGIAVLASSGSGASFDRPERQQVVDTAIDAANGRRVYVAISAPTTRDVLRYARDAETQGAAGLLLTPFSYPTLDQDEVFGLFQDVSAIAGLPICFYNKPVETRFDLSPELLAQLVSSTSVVAVKEPAPRPGRPPERPALLRDAGGPGLSLGFSGDVPMLEGGPVADAWHTGPAALLPDRYAAAFRAVHHGQPVPDDQVLLPVVRALASGGRGVGSLHALAELLGFPAGKPRAPQLPATAATVAALAALVPSH